MNQLSIKQDGDLYNITAARREYLEQSNLTRVLIIEDDRQVVKEVTKILALRGYMMEAATGKGSELIENAKQLALTFRPHVAVVDLRLLGDFSDERSGLELLESLQSASCVLYSAYLTPEVTRKAAKEYKAVNWVSKSEAPDRLLEVIAEAAQQRCARQDMLRFQSTSLTPTGILQILLGEDNEAPSTIVDDILSQLFQGRDHVGLETITGNIVSTISRGHSFVMRANPDNLEPKVVKLAPSEKIQNEQRRYEKHVRDWLVGSFCAQLENSAMFWDLGGVVYSLLGVSSFERLVSFSTFYQKNTEAKVILKPLRHFFEVVWKRHYQQATADIQEPLFRLYDEMLGLQKRLDQLAKKDINLAQPHFSDDLINPVEWVKQHAEDSCIASARRAVTHGDLHGENLFVNENYAWAIDFERTGPGHILRDFIELEIDLVTRLIPWSEFDIEQFYDFVVTLVEPTSPGEPLRPTEEMLASDELHKAIEVINGLRNIARQITGYSNMKEHVWGLLFDALFAAFLTSDDEESKERALILSSVLCGRLRHWNSPWPPKAW
jgi:DNA-binding NarL/FixJ family response regulator